MSRWRHGRLGTAAAIYTCATALAAVALVLDLANGQIVRVLYVATAQALALIALLLTTRRPENRVSWMLAAAAALVALFVFCGAYADTALVEHPGSLPGGLAAAWIANWAWLPTLTIPLATLLLFVPDGHLPSRRWRPVVAVIAAGTVLGALAIGVSATFDLGERDGAGGVREHVTVANPLAYDGPLADAALVVAILLLLGGFVVALVGFAGRYRRSAGDERQQLRWVGLSLMLGVLLAFVGSVTWDVLPVASFLPALGILSPTLGMALAVLRYRLYDIDRVVSRTVTYAVASLVLAGLYAGLVLGGQAVFASVAGGSQLVIAGSTLVVAALFLPVRRRIQRVVDRRFNRRQFDAHRTLEAFGERLREQLEVEELTVSLRGAVSETMQPAHVRVWLRGGR